MNELSSFLTQGYWWLSLLGGIHCIGLGLYIRYIYRESSGNHKLLAGLFSLMALYFFTGMLNRDNAPAPIHLLFTLIIPVYFLLMPLLYLYCYRSLHNIRAPITLSKHFYLPILITIIIFAISLLSNNFIPNTGTLQRSIGPGLRDFKIGAALPALLSLQTGFYFILIVQMLRKYRGHSGKVHQESLKDIKFRWLLVLTLAMMSNWLVRAVLVILPFYMGDQISEATQAFTRLILLLTVYLLALYGLQQITKAAYLRGRFMRQSEHSQAKTKASSQLLDSEELNYLQQLMQEEKKHK